RCAQRLGNSPDAEREPPPTPMAEASFDEHAIPPGQLLGGGRYRVVQTLGGGGMGLVVRALDLRLKRDVAVKLLHSDLVAHPTARRRMTQEAEALARVEHPNVVRVLDVFDEGPQLALVLELVTGGDLSQRVGPGGIPAVDVVPLMVGVLSGLQAIHDAGLVHRDIKPGNILLSNTGVPKITDLGVARDSRARERTQLGAALGTLDYMSPEQVQSLTVDVRSDVYAAGMVLYELLTGHRPYNATTDFDIANAHVHVAPNLRALEGKAPPQLISVVAKALAKAPDDRFASAAAMAGALGSLSLDSARPAKKVAVSPRTSIAATPSPVRQHSSSRTVWAVAASALAAVVVGGVVFAIAGSKQAPVPTGAAVEATPAPAVLPDAPPPAPPPPVEPAAQPEVPVERKDDPPLAPAADAAFLGPCELAAALEGRWLLTTKVFGNKTRGRYRLTFRRSGCDTSVQVDRVGFTVAGPMILQPYSGTAQLQPPSHSTLGLARVDADLYEGEKLRLSVALHVTVLEGELRGIWHYDRTFWKENFKGPVRAVRDVGEDFPDLEDDGDMPHMGVCPLRDCTWTPGGGAVPWFSCSGGQTTCRGRP
ncbi:MAG: serine/threonine-protein kinase, partial [Myxococcota bacterium]